MSFLEILEEQCLIGFTGRVNILKASNKQFLGIVSLLNGDIIRCEYKAATGKKTLFNVLIENISQTEQQKFVVEPEVVESENTDFKLDIHAFKIQSRHRYERYLKSLKLTPPMNLRLIVNAEFILSGETITESEFDVLKVISDYSKVADIYDMVPLYKYEVTEALVSLRQKKAIKVFQQLEKT
ncbi:MAG: hypothetical protein HN576_16880 [Bacteriovoracaceae bacterium]|jgi:hypothetical protein|nr:hypothetical protein [Bacteriovoracaceae bacterium]